MALQLLRSKTGIRRSDDIVNRLVMLVLETGAMTGKRDLGSVSSWRRSVVYFAAVVALLYSYFFITDTVRFLYDISGIE